MRKKQKLPKLTDKHKEMLAQLSLRREFSAFEAVCKVEENNIMVLSFKVNSGDPALAIKKAWMEGRVFELRRLIKTFEDAKKSKEDNE